MGERALENRVRRLLEIEDQKKALEEQADALREEIKKDLEKKGIDEIKTPNFIIRWKEVISNRLDGKALKEALPDVYALYAKASTSRRFTIG
jgi:Phage-related protein, predicted endonuclease